MLGLTQSVFDAFYDYLLVDAAVWKWRLATDPKHAGFEPTPEGEAQRILHALVASHRAELFRLCSSALPLARAWSISSEQLLTAALREAGYAVRLTDGKGLPAIASFYLLRRARKRLVGLSLPAEKPVELAALPRAAPSKVVHYVTVQVVNTAGEPVADAPCELLFADGALHKAATDREGFVFLRGIAGGMCRIRLQAVAASQWKASAGAAPTVIRVEPEHTHRVEQGECLSKIARRYGVEDPMELWNDAKNEALRQRRKSPHVLRPGDAVVVPGLSIGEVQRQTDTVHRLVLARREKLVSVRLRLETRWRKALEGLEYTLSFHHRGRLVTRAGAAPTNHNGLLEEKVPVEVESVVVAFERPRLHFKLLVSALDPTEGDLVDSANCATARLRALGFLPAGGDLSEAITRFQQTELARAEPSGALDSETRDKLEELYGA